MIDQLMQEVGLKQRYFDQIQEKKIEVLDLNQEIIVLNEKSGRAEKRIQIYREDIENLQAQVVKLDLLKDKLLEKLESSKKNDQ